MMVARTARALAVTGVVQGVGFRPFVHGLAVRYGLSGWVRNRVGAVEIHAEGDPDALESFATALAAEAPPLARVQDVAVAEAAHAGHDRFEVLASADEGAAAPALPPDVALCSACREDLEAPGNRRYRYPFITCTDCGPRYTVVAALPYDRERTTMAAFPPCAACAAEYAVPGNRRFRSESNSCPACGPRAWLEPADEGDDVLAAAARSLLAGQVVGIRGMGGFHLAVDATNNDAVRRLRERKQREHKPLAVMCGTVAQAARLAWLDDGSRALLESAERPIVLLPARADAPLAETVAPGIGQVGVMLPSTPLHLLLLEQVGRPLVMTSGNLSDEPLAADNDEARVRLSGVADRFLMHDREIVARCDDSVLRPAPSGPVFIRRARGFAPLPLALPVPSPAPILAVGGQLKHTFALAEGATAWVSPHQGDLDQLRTLEHVQETLAHYQRLLRVAPSVAAHDLHPGYLSTRLAADSGLRLIPVQHHHAHIAAVMAEHGVTVPVVGVALDGTGAGHDGCVWGAEILVGDLRGMVRAGQLRYAPLPGGDRAVRSPWRSLLGWLSLEDATGEADEALARIPEQERALCLRQLTRRLNSPLASSMGRLFDAAASALGVRQVSHYEGQAAMELEALAGTHAGAKLPALTARLEGDPARCVIDPVPLLRALLDGTRAGVDRRLLAAGFHEAVAEAFANVALRVARDAGLSVVALGGGSFQNIRLLTQVTRHLQDAGLRVLRAHRLPPNDGGLAFGQAAVAAARLAEEG